MNDTSSAKVLPFEFTGKTGEFFGIWIVNILLTIITLGFYTPWAKVRTRRYFYGNTVLDNSAFDYTASPMAILKGYLIAVVAFAIYTAVSQIYPPSVFIFLLVFLLLMPWLVVRSMIFRARNSVYRNLRFTFEKSYKEAALIFTGLALLTPFTFGLLMPYLVYRQKKFFVENSGFGQSRFKFHGDIGAFYTPYLILMGLVMVPMVIIGILAAIAIPAYQSYMEQAGQASQFINSAGPDESLIFIGIFIMYGIMILFYVFIFAYLESRIGNLVWNGIEFVTNRFESKLRARDLLWIYFSNIIAIIVSFGLLIPWAKIRLRDTVPRNCPCWPLLI